MKDPYYRKILEGLRGPLDPNAFEECAVALLQKEAYRKLVPIHGGHDDGMDGAIADGEGEAYPLIATTAKDVIRNLSKNLDAYIAGGGPRRKAVVATSTELTATKRKNLQQRAKEKGFDLVQIHDQWDIAGRLYRDSRWTKELLGVTGEPAALSAIPWTRRPIREDVPLIGRDADLTWLRETTGDRIIIGQPGSGKTYLLLQLVREGKALFLASEDEARIAADLRDLQPEIAIVDDAHLEPERLVRLRQIRSEIEGDFELLVTGWPGTEDDLSDALALPPAEKVRTLELLTRKEILEVLRGIGIQAPDDDTDLIFLLNQAANKPGLAVTLGSLWLRGERFDVLTGKALKRTLIPSLKRVVERDPTQILACFALGGDRGVAMDLVGEFLGLGRDEVHRRATRASQGGVLRVVNPREGRLAVEPEALRSALLEEVFFAGSTQPSLSYRALLDRLEHPTQAVETLVIAALRQVPVPRNELRALVAEHGSRDSWCLLARLGEDDGCWVLENYPGRLTDVAPFVLKSAPREAVDRLLKEAVEATGPLHSQPSHPLRILQDWVQEIPFLRARSDRFSLGESLHRRRLVVDVACDWLAGGKGREGRRVAMRAALLALNPRMQSTRPVATGGAVSLHNAPLSASTVPEVLQLWSRLVPHVDGVLSDVWQEISSLIDWWSSSSPGQRDDESEQLRVVAHRMIADLAGSVRKAGARSVLQEKAARIGWDLDLSVDNEFETLFPSWPVDVESGEDLREALARQHEAARSLAEDWASRRPEEASLKLATLHEEAATFRSRQTTARLAFYEALSEYVAEPVEWTSCLVDQGIEANCVQYLLMRAVRGRHDGWQELLEECLSGEEYRVLAADVVLRTEGMPSELVRAVMPHAWAQLVETACLRGEVPLSTLKSLLESFSEEIALAAAVGEWMADPEKSVRPEVQDEWRRAILRFGAETECDDHSSVESPCWLEGIFHSDPGLAFDWLRARIRDAGELESAMEGGVYHSAVQVLNPEQRRQLLLELEPGLLTSQLVPWLVGDSVDLYQCLLERESLRGDHLEPLSQEALGDKWRDMAPLAVEAGHEPRAVAGAVVFPALSGWGYGIDRWSAWKAELDDILERETGPLREIAREGVKIVEERLAAAEAEKRRFELTGRF